MQEKKAELGGIISFQNRGSNSLMMSMQVNDIRRKRNCYDVIFSILINCDGKKKTRIMYAANLNYGLFTKYLSRLEKLNYVVLKDEEYYITEKGRKYLATYREYMRSMTEFENIKKDLENLLGKEI